MHWLDIRFTAREDSGMRGHLSLKVSVSLVIATVHLLSAPAAFSSDKAAAKANGVSAKANGVPVKTARAPSDVIYRLWPQGDLAFAFRTTRPSTKDADVVLSVPAAFTTYDNKIDGVFICEGIMGNAGGVNKEIGGAITIDGGNCQLMSTLKGSLLTPTFLEAIQKSGGSLFQQFLVVNNGKAASFRDKSKFQRRAVVKFKKGSFGIVESDRAITFNTFNDDLVWMGADQALYLDMGAWDEGWFRDATTGKTVVIGNDRSLTHKQSNWLVLRRKADSKPAH